MFEPLRTAIHAYHPIANTTWEALQRALSQKTYSKGDHLLMEGDAAHYIHFIENGLVRAYYLNQDGTPFNKIFFPENTFAASTVSLLNGSSSYFSIDALEETKVIQINYSIFRRLFHEHKDLLLFNLYYIEKNWIIKNERSHIAFAAEEAKDRYKRFLKEYPGLYNRVAQYHIAAHLGITPTQLSRIRKSLLSE